MQQGKQPLWVRLQLFARLTLNAGEDAANQPARLAHLDHGNDRAILVQGQEGPAQIVRLGHRGTPSIEVSDEIAILAARPIASLYAGGSGFELSVPRPIATVSRLCRDGAERLWSAAVSSSICSLSATRPICRAEIRRVAANRRTRRWHQSRAVSRSNPSPVRALAVALSAAPKAISAVAPASCCYGRSAESPLMRARRCRRAAYWHRPVARPAAARS